MSEDAHCFNEFSQGQGKGINGIFGNLAPTYRELLTPPANKNKNNVYIHLLRWYTHNMRFDARFRKACCVCWNTNTPSRGTRRAPGGSGTASTSLTSAGSRAG